MWSCGGGETLDDVHIHVLRFSRPCDLRAKARELVFKVDLRALSPSAQRPLADEAARLEEIVRDIDKDTQTTHLHELLRCVLLEERIVGDGLEYVGQHDAGGRQKCLFRIRRVVGEVGRLRQARQIRKARYE